MRAISPPLPIYVKVSVVARGFSLSYRLLRYLLTGACIPAILHKCKQAIQARYSNAMHIEWPRCTLVADGEAGTNLARVRSDHVAQALTEAGAVESSSDEVNEP
jgi:hypothetical protein